MKVSENIRDYLLGDVVFVTGMSRYWYFMIAEINYETGELGLVKPGSIDHSIVNVADIDGHWHLAVVEEEG